MLAWFESSLTSDVAVSERQVRCPPAEVRSSRRHQRTLPSWKAPPTTPPVNHINIVARSVGMEHHRQFRQVCSERYEFITERGLTSLDNPTLLPRPSSKGNLLPQLSTAKGQLRAEIDR
jgi:hypothetical protein